MAAWWQVFRRDTSDIDDRRIKPGFVSASVVIAVIASFAGVFGWRHKAHAPAPIEIRTETAATDFAEFTSAILGDLADRWTEQFAAAKLGKYHPPKVVLYTGTTTTGGCDRARTQYGPFLCPADDTIYLDPAFFAEIRRGVRLCATEPAACDFAQAFVIAHEHGHHVQRLLGIFKRPELSEGVQEGSNGPSVRLELQADCFAGVWAGLSNQKWHEVAKAYVTAAWEAAWWGGDDHQGATPSEYTHGTSAQRTEWFLRGYDGKSVATCDTWN